MNLKNKLCFLLLPLLMIGCSLNEPKPVHISTEHVNTCVESPKASSVVMRRVDFNVIKDEHGIFWIAMTPKGYENLSQNTSDILAHIKQKNAVIKYYKECVNEGEK